jgi:hypothetical protein
MDLRTLDFAASVATLLALFLALIQLVIAWKEKRESRLHAATLRGVAEKLGDIGGSLSTQYIGALPEYYPEVISLVEDAQHSVSILCDYPAYGCFTNSKHWLEYHAALRDKSAEPAFQLTLICPDARTRAKTDRERYFARADNDWGRWLEETETRENVVISNRQRVATFAKYAAKLHVESATIENFLRQPTKEVFFRILQQVDEAMIQTCFDEKDCVTQITAAIPIDFWIADGKKAIFAFSNYGVGMSRYGFKTTDQTLIRAFQEIVDSYRC